MFFMQISQLVERKEGEKDVNGVFVRSVIYSSFHMPRHQETGLWDLSGNYHEIL